MGAEFDRKRRLDVFEMLCRKNIVDVLWMMKNEEVRSARMGVDKQIIWMDECIDCLARWKGWMRRVW